MLFRRLLPATAAVAALTFAAACGGASDDTIEGKAGDGRLTIGIRFDQPGMAQRRLDGKYVGFDVDVAKYVAQQFGVPESGITWKEARSADRERLIADGQVDFVVATYSITDKRKEQVAFAGPYFQTGQGLLVRYTDGDISGPEALNGKKLCSVTASTSAQKVKSEFAQAAQLVEYGQYSDCVIALLAGKVDAVTTDQAILAGYVAENPELLKLVGKPFTTEKYGVGLAKSDAEGRSAVSAAIEKMVSSGEWRRALERNIGQSGVELPDPPQVTEK
ncbi:glutamate ABC transporter substrate-binding protein [Actinosynnema sp. NPDC047251]|uniref:ABC-type transporter, substrate-binding lipoprotein, family 3 n=1 Tax=Saccharothrix espanaensis (strain ATCC 51144 / DSM 44229 / JCM 9112 / NBRC 15066 / NRRL 15764) TaxID=1179773 RepID=K0KFR9_SACES|nr:glutamate ABC transporter substrate-binding protein [Saccharothrix espanaensis]CCH35383.1 ABC-type transporter, substrate-binding lipoprotein, family 3 [Saccharothrix espanaensis DSM 44229]